MLLKDYVPVSQLVVARDARKLPTMPVFDAHMHWGRLLLGEAYDRAYDTREAVERLREAGIFKVVNLDGESGDALKRMLDKTAGFGDTIKTFGNLDLLRLDEPGFESYVYRTLRESKAAGISGLKFWKVISLVWKDRDGKYIPIDDPRLECVWQAAGEMGLPITIHIADPIAFFEPADGRNERYEELCEHPDWRFDGPGLFSFWELMRQQENLIRSNPGTTFIVAHVGSCAENLGNVSEQLDRYPNMYVDLSARFAELGRQPYTAARFLEQYADRVLYGSDFCPTDLSAYNVNFRFLETKDEYFDYTPGGGIPTQGRWKIYGVGLSTEALKKIYYENALRLIG